MSAACPETEPQDFDGYLIQLAENAPVPLSNELEYVTSGVYWTQDAEYAEMMLEYGMAERVEPNCEVTLFDTQETEGEPIWPYALVGADQAAAYGLSGAGVRIAIIDSGLDPNNQNLESTLVDEGYDYTADTTVMTDTLGHGTYVAQMIAGDGDGGMMKGVAPKATLVPLRCFSERTTDRKLLIRAIEDAADPEKFDCDIINMSWGDGNNSEIMKAALQKAYDAGVILVAAAGNVQTGMPQGTVCYPAAWDTVIGVGSVDAEKNISAFSQQTEAVDVCAPGQAIPFGSLYNVQTTQNGTSFAAPCVSAMLALLLETAPEMTPAFAENLLKEYAQDLGTTGRDDLYGYGFVDFSTLLTVDTWGVDRGAGGVGLWLPGEKTGTVYLAAYDNDGKMCSLQTAKLKSDGLWVYFPLKQEDTVAVKVFFLSDQYMPQRSFLSS